jgi:hypothetical protein
MWRRILRGGTERHYRQQVTEEDIRSLILFGDPGSNRWITDFTM